MGARKGGGCEVLVYPFITRRTEQVGEKGGD
jgi:hypothetical protein